RPDGGRGRAGPAPQGLEAARAPLHDRGAGQVRPPRHRRRPGRHHRAVVAPDALFVPEGDGFRPTDATLGPWGADMLHGGAVSALCVLLLEELGGPELVSTRFSVDLVRPVTVNHLDVEG